MCPAGRAALYTIKPTIGLIPQDGIVPISHHFDSAGPMTKSVYDLASLLDVLASRPHSESFTRSLNGSWSDISGTVLDPDKWKFPEAWVKPVDGAEGQIVCAHLETSSNWIVTYSCRTGKYARHMMSSDQRHESLSTMSISFPSMSSSLMGRIVRTLSWVCQPRPNDLQPKLTLTSGRFENKPQCLSAGS